MTSLPPSVRHARGLYLITPEEPDTARLLARVAAVLPKATWLQYRQKSADAGLRHAQATALQALCMQADVPLIINDDVALAEAVGAAGVHLGEDDGDLGAARHRLGPHAIVGASCYDDAALALLNFAYGLFVLPESLPPERRAPRFDWSHAHPFGSLKLLARYPQVFGLAAVVFIANLAHYVYPSVFVLYADYRYG